jgi:hypothetical protein
VARVFGTHPVQVVPVRPPGAPDGYDLALATTDLDASAAELVARYAARWSIEVCFEEARQLAGVGQARNRSRRAAFRRALIAAGYRAGQPLQPTSTEILEVQAAWAGAGP